MTDTSPSAILRHARAVLDGTHRVPRSQAPRVAAVLARQALEDVVRQHCEPNLTRASMRSRLIVLRVLVGGALADVASTAWCGLSRACHHHAYELTPTFAEVRHLVEQVADLITLTGKDPQP